LKVSVKKVLKWTGIILAILFVAIQFIRPSRVNPPVDESKTLQATTQVPQDVGAILERSCNDCHSSRTEWPWYSEVSPLSWYLVRHVNEGRRELSFSNWGTYQPRRMVRKLQQICDEVEHGDMPLKSYLPLHPTARLSGADKQVLCNWANQERTRVLATQPAASQ
jgi:Haem-binding domain